MLKAFATLVFAIPVAAAMQKLTRQEIAAAVAYVRTFRRWGRR